MRKNSKFTEFETIKEFKEWLDKQNPVRKITRLQVHHMDIPNYSHWRADVKRWGDNACLNRTLSLDEYGKATWNCSDNHGHYIAQHFNIFPNGHITTGRHLNSSKIGIKGWNANAICIEIYGDFDKGMDIMTDVQKEAVIAVYALLAKKFNIPINADNIRPHAWFTASGDYLGGYSSTKSAKTCPGTNFMGFGNSFTAFKKNFYPLIRAYEYKETDKAKTDFPLKLKVINEDGVNYRSEPKFKTDCVVGEYKYGDILTVVALIDSDTATDMYKIDDGNYITASSKYVEEYEEPIPKMIKIVYKEGVKYRSTPKFLVDDNVLGVAEYGTVFTVVDKVESDCKTAMYKLKSGCYITASAKYVEPYEK